MFIHIGSHEQSEQFSREKKFSNKHHVLDSLRPLWTMRKSMNFSCRSFKDFIVFLLKNENAEIWLKYLLAAYATDHMYGKIDNQTGQEKTSDPETTDIRHANAPKVSGATARPVVEMILFPILFQLTGIVQLYFIQLILPVLILYWFSPRVCAIVNVFVISEKDYKRPCK